MKCIFSFLVFLLVSFCAFSQNPSDIANEKMGIISFEPLEFIGLWKVDEVLVGNEPVTPTAKWFLYEDDRTLTSGNGWLQNGMGTWSYDSQQKTLLHSNMGEVDEFGAFSLSFEEDKMIWQRTEEGLPVRVTLSRTNKKPLAPWDKIVGRWTINSAQGLDPNTGKVVTEYMLDNTEYFFRWDRLYIKFNKEGNREETGVWNIEAHAPWLTLFNDSNTAKSAWNVEFEGDQMIWTHDNEKEVMKVYLKKG